MKKVFIFIICTILLVGGTDIIIGMVCTNYIKTHHLPGRYQPLDKLVRQTDADMILIGNSVISNSINPAMLEDSLNMTCYNGGITGQGIFFFETMVDCILQRHKPKTIILGFRPEELGENVGEGVFDVLRPYYHIGFKSIDQHFDNSSKYERILLQSSLYRYNIIWIRIILHSFFDKQKYSQNGFHESGIPRVLPQKITIDKADKLITEKLNSLERIIQKCQSRNIKVYVCFPPEYFHFTKQPLPCITAVKDLCERKAIPCFVDYDDPDFLSKPELFSDNIHLNKYGAAIYTNKIISRIPH